MNSAKNVLVLGATGAMGQYLVPELAGMGYNVDAYALEDFTSEFPNVKCFKANVMDPEVYQQIYGKHYDGVVDFMIYGTESLPFYVPIALKNTDHYIFLSSYRAYDNKQIPIIESSPKCCDSADDADFRFSEDYAVYKGRGEHLIRSTSYRNWTIIRPAITYSKMRYQLVTLEAPNTVGRAFKGKTVVLPAEAYSVQGTMSWAGNVAQMIARLLFNEKALHEDFSVCTAEHHTWAEVAEYYKDICGLKSVWVPQEDFLSCIVPPEADRKWSRWQLKYDRLFTRIMDNSKVLKATGLKQSDFMSLYDGLKHEIARCPKDYPFRDNALMDAYLDKMMVH